MAPRDLIRAAGVALLVLCAGPDGVAAETGCDKEKATPRAHLDCLGNAQKEGERDLERTFAGALAAIRGDGNIAPPQRARWVNLMEEAQGRFVHWRNFECQNIAPYEGGGARQTVGGRLGGIGSLEQRLICLIERNGARTADLARRYPPPAGWSYAEPTPPEPTPAAEPAAPAGPVRIIEMPGSP